MKIGIDLTWLKPRKTGGGEAYIRNLLDGFLELKDKNDYILLVAKDNMHSFEKYKKDSRVKFVYCNTYANKIKSHLLWQNFCEYKVLKKAKINFCFFPIFEMPLYRSKKIKTVVTIHDIQAIHYPEYFSFMSNMWFKIGWKSCLRNANKVIVTSEYTKKDIYSHFKVKNGIDKIYIPIVLNNSDNFASLRKKYLINKNEYYYTICSLHKHKNLITLINVMEQLKNNPNKNLPKKLVISGVGGPQQNEILSIIKDKNLEENIILTNFISNEERNSLIKNANAFLFPSLFEGFGMPPIEAMMLGAKVISTKCASLEEVTEGKCEYVDNPTDAKEWIVKIEQIQSKKSKVINFPQYDKKNIAREYLDLFYRIDKNKII